MVSVSLPLSVEPERHRPSVLIVDDDRWTTRAVAAALADAGEFDVLAPANSGEDGVRAYTAHHPDLVLMDVNMPPGISGVDATRAIVRSDPDATVVLLTTVSPGPGISRALEAGAMAVVNKTASDEVLVSVVRTALQGESPSLLKALAADIVISGDLIPDAPSQAPVLTEKELSLLTLICEGLEYADIADQMHLSISTVKTHAQNLRAKLDAGNLAQLVVRALQYKFYSPE